MFQVFINLETVGCLVGWVARGRWAADRLKAGFFFLFPFGDTIGDVRGLETRASSSCSGGGHVTRQWPPGTRGHVDAGKDS